MQASSDIFDGTDKERHKRRTNFKLQNIFSIPSLSFILYPLSFILSLHQEFCRKLQGASKNVFGRRGVKIKTASSTFN
jgi:hypothetical protein